MPKVSIIIPYYNSAKTILRALNSVVNQTYKDYEIILIDDGSIDNSYKIVNDFIKKNKKIKIINIHQENTGPSKARNRGINKAKGKYIAFLDSDDEWSFNKLESQIELMEKMAIDMIGCNINVIKDSKVFKKYLSKSRFKRVTFKDMLFKHYFLTPTVVVKKEVIVKEGSFPENQKLAEDNYIFTKIARRYNAYITNDFFVNIFKDFYGESGLSAKLDEAQKWELINFYRFRKENSLYEEKLGLVLYIIVNIFSVLKYIRRKIIVITKKVVKSFYKSKGSF
jgi:glycosyltransferase involved in cell wall biosynthesis